MTLDEFEKKYKVEERNIDLNYEISGIQVIKLPGKQKIFRTSFFELISDYIEHCHIWRFRRDYDWKLVKYRFETALKNITYEWTENSNV